MLKQSKTKGRSIVGGGDSSRPLAAKEFKPKTDAREPRSRTPSARLAEQALRETTWS